MNIVGATESQFCFVQSTDSPLPHVCLHTAFHFGFFDRHSISNFARRTMDTANHGSPSRQRKDSYLALVPRGLEHVILEIMETKLIDHYLQVSFVGESMEYAEEDVNRIRQRVDVLRKKKARRKGNDQPPKTNWKSPSALSTGSAHDDTTGRHMNLGYYQSDEKGRKKRVVLSHPGQLDGVVWLKFITDAPTTTIANLRCLGPLISLIKSWENIDINESHTLEDVKAYVQNLVSSSEYPFQPSLQVWHEHVQHSWSFPGNSDNDDNDERTYIRQAMQGKLPMKFRLSCTRSKSDQYKYTRQEFVSCIADSIVTPESKWKVDLTKYNVEVVILVHPHCLAVGFACRPYRQLGAKGFFQGTIPPDVTPPYLSGNILSGVVRLRPTTAHVLLHLAKLETGDVLLDPCVGIGTIPMEVPYCATAIGLGGDLVLTQDGMGSVGSKYVAQVRQEGQTSTKFTGATNLMAWDATLLPVRSSSVDVIVSDLPFGQTCMSSSKLANILPLMIEEMGRVLSPITGRLVLLCGSYQPILNAFQYLNDEAVSSKDGEDSASSTCSQDRSVWQLPCKSVFPVNVGGLMAWIIHVNRGPGDFIRVPNRLERIRKLAHKRQRIAKHLAKEEPEKESQSKYRRIQSR